MARGRPAGRRAPESGSGEGRRHTCAVRRTRPGRTAAGRRLRRDAPPHRGDRPRAGLPAARRRERVARGRAAGLPAGRRPGRPSPGRADHRPAARGRAAAVGGRTASTASPRPTAPRPGTRAAPAPAPRSTGPPPGGPPAPRGRAAGRAPGPAPAGIPATAARSAGSLTHSRVPDGCRARRHARRRHAPPVVRFAPGGGGTVGAVATCRRTR